MAYFTRIVVIERGTVREMCAIDSNFIVIRVDRDMITYESLDSESWVEYQKYLQANKKAITKEELDRYRY